MAKRAAAVQLTSDNFEKDMDEEEVNEPGKFEQASEDQLKQRVIKKAARRTYLPSAANGGGGGGLFAGLKPMSGSVFGGLSGSGAGVLGRAPLSSVNQLSAMSSTRKDDRSINGLPSANGLGENVSEAGSEYLSQLQALNESVTEWISSHVKKNPHVDLTPIFKDYEKHLTSIDMKYKPLNSETESSQESDHGGGESTGHVTDSADSASQNTEQGDDGDAASQVTMENDDATTVDEEENQSQTVDSQPSTSSAPSSAPCSQDDDDTSLMSVRAKLFYKKAEEYTELGVGSLKVQSSNGDSVRLLLRNDTSLGKVLLNVRLTTDVPMSLTKNNVIVVCPPNPPLGKEEDGAVTYLIRVKTAPLAEQLHTTIKDNLK